MSDSTQFEGILFGANPTAVLELDAKFDLKCRQTFNCMAAAIFQTASWQLLVPLLESFLGRERFLGLAHGWVLQWNQPKHRWFSTRVSVWFLRHSPSSRQAAETSALSSFSPIPSQEEKGKHNCGVTEVSVSLGAGCPEQIPVPELGHSAGWGQETVPKVSPWPPLWLCSGKGADFRCTKEQDVPVLSALPRNCSFDANLLRTSELGLSSRNSSYYWFSLQTALSVYCIHGVELCNRGHKYWWSLLHNLYILMHKRFWRM